MYLIEYKTEKSAFIIFQFAFFHTVKKMLAYILINHLKVLDNTQYQMKNNIIIL